MLRLSSLAAAVWIIGLCTSAFAQEAVPLDTLDFSKLRLRKDTVHVNRSVRETTLSIAGKRYERGVGTRAPSKLWINLAGEAQRFQAWVGLDRSASASAVVTFGVYGDSRKLWESGPMKKQTAPSRVDLDVKGVRNLLLKVDAAEGTRDGFADWADACILTTGTKPKAMEGPQEEALILTPKPGPEPRINGPKLYGCRPGNPFLYRIPATGKRPMTFGAKNLPDGLSLDPTAGILRGTAPPRGQYRLTLSAENAHGKASRPFTIVSGDRLALTPYMGWNHWYTHYSNITDQLMRQAADAITSSGMADVGYDYVCIDDCWMRIPARSDAELGAPVRDANGNLLPNSRFPDMKALTDYIHSKGLKAGIYTSPGPTSCGGYAGSFGHEAQDARQFADWGFDLLKYDLCSYRKVVPDLTLEEMQKPYALMGNELRAQKRDIIFNLCQYGKLNVWEWGADVGGHSWRTAGDLGFSLDSIFEVALKNLEHRAWCGPGRWNDPDYIQIGYFGHPRSRVSRPCPMAPTEQYAFMSLWSMMAAPLVFSGDMGKLDEFTLSVLCNPEVIEINQDSLGQCASLSRLNGEGFLLVKNLEDGSKAVGLCNAGEEQLELAASWAVLGVQGKQQVRDVWRQKDLGVFEGQYRATVGRRAVVLVRISPAQ